MDKFVIIIVIIIILGLLCDRLNSNEEYYYETPSLSYNAEQCGLKCDNTVGCNSYYYDPVTRQCWQNSTYKYGDLYYPYVNRTNYWIPSKYRFGKYLGDIQGKYRPLVAKYR